MTVPMIKSIGDVPYPIDTHSDAFSPLLTAGAALGITGEATDSAAWLQRVSTSDGPTTIRSIHGRTLRWNQLAARRFTDVKMSDGVSFDYTQEGVISISGTATENVSFALCPNITTVVNHKYLARAQVEGATIDSIDGYAVSLSPSDAFSGGSMRMPAEGRIYTSTEARNNVNLIFSAQNGTAISGTIHSRPQFFDLTAMFGAGSEPSTVAEFESLYPLPYYEYDAGSLLPVSMTGIESTGFNQLDPANVRNDIFVNGATGKVSAASWAQTAIVEVFPNTDYCLTYTSGNRCIIAGVDSMTPAVGDDARVIFNGDGPRVSPKVFNTGANRYIACYVATSAAPASDICINLSDPTRNGTYEPYWQRQRSILAGTLRSAGSVYDEQTETERIVRIGEVDLGTLTWTYTNAHRYYSDEIASNILLPANTAIMPYITAEKYRIAPATTSLDTNTDVLTVLVDSTPGRIVTYAESADAPKPSGLLFYALAEPTVTPIDPALNLSYRVDDFGTERVMVPTGELSAPPTIVAAQGYTAESLRDAALSAIAPVENGLASTNYAVGSYLVHGGQLCKVTTAIATGEAITIGTNVTTTTVMAEVIALTQ